MAASPFVSAIKITQCHVTTLMDTASVNRDGLGKNAHYVSTVDRKY